MAKCAKCFKSAQLSFFGPSGGKSHTADPFSIVPGLSFGEMHQMRQISPTFLFGSSGGKSDAADPFLMVPRASFEICAKCVKSAQLFFFGPCGGKSDAADPFWIVPRLTFGEMGQMRQIGPTLFCSDPLGVNRTLRIRF